MADDWFDWLTSWRLCIHCSDSKASNKNNLYVKSLHYSASASASTSVSTGMQHEENPSPDFPSYTLILLVDGPTSLAIQLRFKLKFNLITVTLPPAVVGGLFLRTKLKIVCENPCNYTETVNGFYFVPILHLLCSLKLND